MGVNKITYGNTTLIDLTSDTVTAETLLEGYTAHDANGNIIRGTLVQSSFDIDDVYPVGSIYMNATNVSPATLFGGTWERLSNGVLSSAGDERFLVPHTADRPLDSNDFLVFNDIPVYMWKRTA